MVALWSKDCKRWAKFGQPLEEGEGTDRLSFETRARFRGRAAILMIFGGRECAVEDVGNGDVQITMSS